jgi:hypothetical protein
MTASDTATMSEIDAAARLSFDHERAAGLIRIAQRPGLHGAVQVRLVNAAYRCLSFDHQRVEVLRAVIANPSFHNAARRAIVSQLQKLAFAHHCQEILRAIDLRMAGN